MVLSLAESLEVYPQAVCLAVQSTFFGLVFGVGLSYFCKNEDGWKIRAFVTLQLAINLTVLAVSWQSFIWNMDQWHELSPLGMSVAAIVLAAFDIMLSQYFLCYHVIRLSKTRLGVACAFFIFAFATVGFVLSAFVMMNATSLQVNGVIFHLLQEFSVFIADIIATVFLFRHYKNLGRRGFGFVHHKTGQILTSTIMRKITVLVVDRGLLVTCAQAAFFGPTTIGLLTWVPLNASLANVYVLTTLVILTTRGSIRSSLRHGHPDHDHERGALDTMTRTANGQSMVVVQPRCPQERFNIETVGTTTRGDVEKGGCDDKR